MLQSAIRCRRPHLQQIRLPERGVHEAPLPLYVFLSVIEKCEKKDSNLYCPDEREILSLLCLPIPPFSHETLLFNSESLERIPLFKKLLKYKSCEILAPKLLNLTF